MMSSEFLLGLVGIPHSPPLVFCIGLLSSFVICSLVLMLEAKLFVGPVSLRGSSQRASSLCPIRYQRFRNELVSFPRHIGFAAGKVHELEDHEFHD